MSARDIVIRYLELVAAGGPVEAIDALLHPDVEQTEYANALSPVNRTRDRAGILSGLEAGARIMAEQRYGEPALVVSGDTVVAEFDWSGTTAVDLGPLPEGTLLAARICAVIELRDGRIIGQRNYDCYLPPVPPGDAARSP